MINPRTTCAALVAAIALARAPAAVAQAPPPLEFSCIEQAEEANVFGRRLTWQAPAAPCGSLEEVEVYGALSEDGAFELLGTAPATDAGGAPVDALFLSTTELRGNSFFYLVGRYGGACSPAEGAPGATVNLFLPQVPLLTVERSRAGTRLTWSNDLSDPRVAGFIISRQSPAGPVELDRGALTATEYLDAGAQTDPAGATYFVSAIDACAEPGDGNTGLSSPWSSIALQTAEPDPCSGTLTLTRSQLTEWPRTFTAVEVDLTPDGGPTETRALATGEATVRLEDVDFTANLTVQVRYLDDGGGLASSLPVDLRADTYVADDAVEVAQVTFLDSAWQLRWRWNPDAEYRSASYTVRDVATGEAVAAGGAPPDRLSVRAPTLPLDVPADFDWAGRELVVTATDRCGVVRESPPALPVVVRAEAVSAAQARVRWQLPEHAFLEEVVSWDLRRSELTGSSELLRSSTETEFLADLAGASGREVCFEVNAEVVLGAEAGRAPQRYTWRSAPACVARPTRVFLPTGFAPEGVTQEYRPVLGNAEGAGYRMEIYDRWGTRVFATEEPGRGWPGNYGGRAAPQGLYLAVVRLTGDGGEEEVTEQSFALVR